MSDAANRIVQKLWSYCNVLRDDGLSYQDYLEQLTFLLFLKMADEREQLTGQGQPIPAGWRWENLASSTMEGAELDQHYRETLRVLGTRGGMLGLIFEKAQNRIQDPAKLRRLIVELIGREDWSAMAADVKADAYEGLLEKNAQDVKGGAGQYFTPRAVIQAIVDPACVQPQPGEVVVDPACGTGGWRRPARAPDHDRRRLTRRARWRTSSSPTRRSARRTVVNAEGETGRQSLTYNRPDLDNFVACYRPGARHTREATWSEQTPEGRWRPYSYDEIVSRDKVSLDLFWLRDESLADAADLPEPHVLAREIADDLRSALGQMEEILADLEERTEQVE